MVSSKQRKDKFWNVCLPVSGQFLDPEKKRHNLGEKAKVMYSSEELERFYLDYQSEWVPRGMTLQAYCSRNNVPYKVMENYSRNIHKKIVEVKNNIET